MSDGMNRRRFLTVLGATGGGAALLGACGVGEEQAQKLIPYLTQPEDQVPGIATWYATTCRECPSGCGVRAKVREGRVIKLEGNPDAQVGRGHLCARGQAALEGVYNPDRVTDPLARNAQGQFEKISWTDALARFGANLKGANGHLAILTGQESGSFGDLVDELAKSLGGRHVVYEPFAFEALREGNRLAFGTTAVPSYDFARASYILSFGADFLDTWLSPVDHQTAFARAHGFAAGNPAMAKLVFVGPRMSLTGMNADEWLAPVPGTEGRLALAVASVIVRDRLASAQPDVGRLSGLLGRHTPDAVAAVCGIDAKTIERVARELAAGDGLVVAGGMAAHYPNGAEIVAAVNVLNYVTGAVGKTVQFGPNQNVEAGTFGQMAELVADMAGGRISVLVVTGTNPGHSLGGAFWQAWAKVGTKVVISPYLDETASAADLVLPELHPLEQWNDSRPRAGVWALQQPVMQPVYATARAAGDVLLAAAGKPGSFKDYLQTSWHAVHGRLGHGTSFDDFWNDALAKGGVASAASVEKVRLAAGVERILAGPPDAPALDGGAHDPVLIAFPSPTLYDGRGANKPWLQELPDPVSKIMWHSWVEVHPDTATSWGVTDGDLVVLQSPFGAVSAPVWMTPAIRPGVLAVPTGQGHTAFGRYAKDRSFNAFDLLGGAANGYAGRTFTVRVSVKTTGDHRFLATNVGDPRELGGGEEIVRSLTYAKAKALKPGDRPFRAREYPVYADSAEAGWAVAQRTEAARGNYAGHQPRWAMAIDLARCTGCSACVTACYAENNLPTVGEDLVLRRRQISWMRIERYWREDDHGLQAVVTPMLCQQCEQAPCEPVCPVFAAYHTPDGLNGQVYNRCVGTRYCANNCAYKVRYFNWFNFAERGGEWEAWPAPLDWQLNPDVTVREKGVMEKCTFCVQRIRGAQNQARLEDRTVQDGEITPACAQSCPSEAIVFGDLHDPASRVAQVSADPRGYHVFEELNTRPGITYLARVVHAEEA
ncbi:MAG TPA: molybdopterin-dependent oxidoreductase [Gemmatimonadales bacterium]|nr:molybdopterin-dependent oxidoreductase [Gemmatimonadales bacterium]